MTAIVIHEGPTYPVADVGASASALLILDQRKSTRLTPNKGPFVFRRIPPRGQRVDVPGDLPLPDQMVLRDVEHALSPRITISLTEPDV